jgi:3-oxoacyl-[acyl-carrier-protein] synthase III
MRKIKIMTTAKYLPKRAVTAEEMDIMLGVESGWVAKQTGVLTRYFVSDGETAHKMGAIVAREALDRAALKFSEIDLLVATCGTYGQPLPNNASLILAAMGEFKTGTPTFDLNCTCLSFVVAFDHLSYLLDSGRYKRILFVTAEVASVGLNFNQKESSALMGDGAVAVIVEKVSENDDCGIIASRLETYAEGAHLAEISGGGTTKFALDKKVDSEDFYFNMDGAKIYRLASKYMPEFCDRMFAESQTTFADYKLVIPHQASMAGLKLMQAKLKLSDEQFYIYIQNHGNCIAASIPLGLHNAIEEKRIKRGDNVLLLGTAAGFSIGGVGFKY